MRVRRYSQAALTRKQPPPLSHPPLHPTYHPHQPLRPPPRRPHPPHPPRLHNPSQHPHTPSQHPHNPSQHRKPHRRDRLTIGVAQMLALPVPRPFIAVTLATPKSWTATVTG